MRRFVLQQLRPSTVVHAAVALVAAGCHDFTAPPSLPRTSSFAVQSPPVPALVVVVPAAMHGWSFTQGTTGQSCTDASACRLMNGPGTPPLGTGSAELTATSRSATALAYHGHGGTPLERITSLRYSVYRADTENDAVMTLQLSVDLDASRRTEGNVVHVVLEPRASGSDRMRPHEWHSVDAMAGSWWTDHQGKPGNDETKGHPCVRARPCSWGALLARYPNMALHSAEPTVLLVARGDVFRGNIDDVIIGIDGQNTTFDFELVPQTVGYAFTARVGDGVVSSGPFGDTVVSAGTVIPYAFLSRAGRLAPLVFLDDTIVLPAIGQVVMNAAHTLTIVSDTAYSYETLTPLERQIADLTAQLLAASDKVTAAQAVNAFLVAQANAGVAPQSLARAAAVAQHVVIDPVRDAAALSAIDAALGGQDFHYEYAGYNGPGQLSTWTSRDWPSPATSASRLPPASFRDRIGLASPPASSHADRTAVADADNPLERTRVIYTNGIWTSYDEAFSSAIALATLVYAERRFHNYYTGVTLHYNPTRSVQMKAWDDAHPCETRFLWEGGFSPLPYRLVKLALCKQMSFAAAFTSRDLIESLTARVQFDLHLPPSNDVVTSLVNFVSAYRSRDYHVLLVGHSEGVILQAQAVQQLPAREHHPLEVANRCVGILALAPPTDRVSYGIDAYHLMGLLAQLDIIRSTESIGWEEVQTPLTRAVSDSLLKINPWRTLTYMVQIHGVMESYLTGEVAPKVTAHLVALHRECVAGSANLQPSSAVVALGDLVTAKLDVFNQNGRPLLGRKLDMPGDYMFERRDSITFRAMAPAETPGQLFASIAPGFDAIANVTVPLVKPSLVITETPLWSWEAIRAANGANGTSSPLDGPPTDAWDGSAGTCGRRVTYTGAAGNWVEYELRCNRVYTPVFPTPDTLSTGRRIVRPVVYFTDRNGATDIAPPDYYYCAGATPCITSGYGEWLGEAGVVGRSSVVAPVIGASSATADRLTAAGTLFFPTRRRR
jgi:hypothetical protein